MKAMILAAGRGQRMRPLTDTKPKPLLTVNDKPLLAYHLEKLAAEGVSDVVINHAWLGQQIEQYVGSGEQWGLNVAFSAEREGGLETAGGVINALPLLGDEPFWLINGDIWTDFSFAKLPRQLAQDDVAHLMMVSNPDHNPRGDFCLKQGRLQNTPEGEMGLTYSGIGLYRPQWFANRPCEKLAMRPLLEEAIKHQQLAASMMDARWTDVGTPERLQQLDSALRG